MNKFFALQDSSFFAIANKTAVSRQGCKKILLRPAGSFEKKGSNPDGCRPSEEHSVELSTYPACCFS
jgi:hypothetical protein